MRVLVHKGGDWSDIGWPKGIPAPRIGDQIMWRRTGGGVESGTVTGVSLDASRPLGSMAVSVDDGPPYEARVEQITSAIHADCEAEWRAIAAVDPERQVTMHPPSAHYGQAHSLVRRIFPELDSAR